MMLETLRIQDFRNIPKASLSFCSGLNLLTGGNGEGKTNLLEAVGLIANGRSFRRAPPIAMRRHGQSGFYLKADIFSNLLNHDREFSGHGQRLIAKQNGKSMTSTSLMGDILSAVTLTPDAPALIRGAPGERRDYLDWVIYCSDRSYATIAKDHQTALKARNQLLRDQCQDALQFNAWEERLAVLGAQITQKRRWVIEQLGKRLMPFLEGLALDPMDYHWRLACQLDRFSPLQPEEFALRYREMLAQSRKTDLFRGHTTVGPHRDDLLILQKERPLARFGSRGQQKRFLLGLKLAEADFLHHQANLPPLLLLDDPTTELDPDGVKRLMALLAKGAHQLFLATCDDTPLSWPEHRPSHFFSVSGGAFFVGEP